MTYHDGQAVLVGHQIGILANGPHATGIATTVFGPGSELALALGWAGGAFFESDNFGPQGSEGLQQDREVWLVSRADNEVTAEDAHGDPRVH